MSKIVVTGSHGYIGSTLVPMLKKVGHWTWPVILAEADIVIHLAAIASNTLGEIDKKETWQINYFDTIKLAKVAKEGGVKKFIFASALSIFTNPESTYSLTKYHAECELMSLADENFKVIIIRPGVVWGPSLKMRYDTIVNNFMLAKRFNSGIRIKNPKAKVPIVRVDNLCKKFIEVLDSDTAIYNVKDEELTVKEIAKRYAY